jgi:hypothetical protein
MLTIYNRGLYLWVTAFQTLNAAFCESTEEKEEAEDEEEGEIIE